MIPLYPLKFKPILKEKIWGGQKLNQLLNKKSDLENIGESWEISDVKGSTSIISNGALKDQSLSSILKAYKSALEAEHVPAYIKDILQKQEADLQTGHDQIKSLRDSVLDN